MVLGHTWLRGARQLNDFRFQYAYAAFYGYPRRQRGVEGNRRVPAGARRAARRRDLQLSVADLRQQLRLHQPREPLGVPRHLRDEPRRRTASSSAASTTTCPTSPRARATTPDSGTYTFSRDQYFDPDDPASIAALTGAATFSASTPPTRPAIRRSTTSASSRTTGALLPNLTVNLGLRYERLYGNANEDLDVNSFPVTLPYVDVDARGDTNNFGPRVGVAWDVFGNSQHRRPRRLRPASSATSACSARSASSTTSSSSRSASPTRRIPIPTRAAIRSSSSSRRRRRTSRSSPTT